MSIIQDALKKAQGEYVEQKPYQASKESGDIKIKARPSARPGRKISTRLPALVSVAAALILVYGLFLSLQYSKKRSKDLVAPNIPAAPPAAAALRSNKASLPVSMDNLNFTAANPAVFKLNGIMYIESRPQAIINGHVLEEGDKINGATILVIEKDCVLLDVNNSNLRLDLER